MSSLDNHGHVQQKSIAVKEEVQFTPGASTLSVKTQDASQNGIVLLPNITDGSSKTLDVNDSTIGMSRIADNSITNAKLQTITATAKVNVSALDISGATEEITVNDGDYFVINDASGGNYKLSFDNLNVAVDNHSHSYTANTIPSNALQDSSANNILQFDSSGVANSVAVSGDLTASAGAFTIGNDAVSSAKLADQTEVVVSDGSGNDNGIVFNDSTGRWKLSVDSGEFKILWDAGSMGSYVEKWSVNNS